MSWKPIILIGPWKRRTCSAFFLELHRRTSFRWDTQHPCRSLGVWVAIDFLLIPPPPSPSLLLTTNIHEVIRVIDIYWVIAMAEAGGMHVARRKGVQVLHMHARQTRIDTRLRFSCICETSVITSTQQEQKESWVFYRDAIVPAHFLDNCNADDFTDGLRIHLRNTAKLLSFAIMCCTNHLIAFF